VKAEPFNPWLLVVSKGWRRREFVRTVATACEREAGKEHGKVVVVDCPTQEMADEFLHLYKDLYPELPEPEIQLGGSEQEN